MYLNASSSYPSPVYGLTGDDMWKKCVGGAISSESVDECNGQILLMKFQNSRLAQ